MISPYLVYWITRLDSIIGAMEVFLFLTIVISTIGTIVLFISLADDEDTNAWPIALKAAKIIVPIVAVFFILKTFIPTTKEAAAIYIIPKISNNESVQEIPKIVAKLMDAKLQKWIADTLETTEGKWYQK